MSVRNGSRSQANPAWYSGVRLGSRGGASSRTSQGNGSSWARIASSTRARTEASTSRYVAVSSTSPRTTTVLTKLPSASRYWRCSLPEVGVPTRTSDWPLSRLSSTK